MDSIIKVGETNLTTYDQFMSNHFPNLILRPPLFYDWNVGIRFELGDSNAYDLDPNLYMERVYKRAIELFKAINEINDEIIIVTNAFFAYKLKNKVKRVNLYRKYIKSKHLLRNLKLNVIPDVFADEDEIPDELNNTYRYMINCNVNELDYSNLIKAICNQDVGIKPSIYHDVFFLNIRRGTIYHIYDDRGCDVISNSISGIKDIFLKYNDWILNNDRESINKTFDEVL